MEEVTDEPLYRDRMCGIDIGKSASVINTQLWIRPGADVLYGSGRHGRLGQTARETG